MKPGNVTVALGAHVNHEDPYLMAGLYSLAGANPLSRFTVTSGDRTKQPLSGAFPIAPEGSSNHEIFATGRGPFDEAIDVTLNGIPVATMFTDAELAAHGLHAPVGGDPVHLTLVGVSG